MDFSFIPALAAFALVSSITPGPNNLMLMASGANFGFRRTLAHMLGVALGFVFMLILVGAGLSEVFDRYPVSYTILKSFSVVYLLWLAWKIANASPPEAKGAEGRPFSFIQAAAFQWVNPKAWAMALTAFTVYAPSQSYAATIGVAAIFGIVNLPSIACWTVLGREMRRILKTPRHLRAFNITMAALLVVSLYPLFLT